LDPTSNGFLLAGSQGQGVGSLCHRFRARSFFISLEKIFLQIQYDLLVRFQKGGEDGKRLLANGTEKPKDEDANTFRSGMDGAQVIVVPMGTLMVLAATKTGAGTVRLRDA
jgi:hypothetical protein